MANRTASCRVCGKQFVPCGKSSAEIGAFNYREVACSPECGQEYLRRVLENRNSSKDRSEDNAPPAASEDVRENAVPETRESAKRKGAYRKCGIPALDSEETEE